MPNPEPTLNPTHPRSNLFLYNDEGNRNASMNVRIVGSSSSPSGGLTDHSDTINQGNAPQEVMPANPNRKYFLFQNISDVDMWINFGEDASAGVGSILVMANGVYEPAFIPTNSVSVICSVSGKAYTAKEG